MKSIAVSDHKIADWLYYETGFEQLHPQLDIHEWMESLGYEYYRDWNCRRIDQDHYVLEFPSAEVASLFLLRWS